jgi:membrane-associated phospholipid phosphatase
MDWLHSLDVAGFRFFNSTLSNPLFDWAMPFLSWNKLFIPAVILLAIGLVWKGGPKGRLFVTLMLATVAIGDGFICNGLKDGIGRLRPFNDIPDAIVLVGKGGSGSMPSSHTANWFSAMAVAFIFHRRSILFMAPMACLIGFSRVYLGVHYPADVMAGAALGVGYATTICFGVNRLWLFVGTKWFPIWYARWPRLIPDRKGSMSARDEDSETKGAAADPKSTATMEQHWIRLGYLLIAVMLLARWGYLAADKIELSEDEAYQWLWAKHPALSFYSKPPFVAYAQWIGTSIWGDTAFGVRFLSPLIGAILSLLVFRFLIRETNLRVGVWMLLVPLATPLLAVGTILMTIDPLNVLFWTASILTGWRAMKEDSMKHWAWTGLWIGCGFLSKYQTPFNLLCWATFFVLWQPARAHLCKRGPYLALGIAALCMLPVILWNWQNDWITLTHLGERGGLDRAWKFNENFIIDFSVQELGLLNPVFFLATIWAAVAVWRKHRKDELLMFLFSMSVPLFLFFFFYTLRSRVQPNWIAPSVIPMFCLAAIYWERRQREGLKVVGKWLLAGWLFGAVPAIVLHDTNLIQKASGHWLQADLDPLRRVRAWNATSQIVESQRLKLAEEGKPTFIIGAHYGIAGELSFYIPEAREDPKDNPLVYYQSSVIPKNQFFFWPSYTNRIGDNAIYARRSKVDEAAPERLLSEFESVTSLGLTNILYRGRVFRTIQIFECRGVKAHEPSVN